MQKQSSQFVALEKLSVPAAVASICHGQLAIWFVSPVSSRRKSALLHAKQKNRNHPLMEQTRESNQLLSHVMLCIPVHVLCD